MFNEERGAENCVRRVGECLAAIPGRRTLLVVDDGSRDATGAILDRLAAVCPALTVVHHERNRGYGAALRTGTRAACEAGYEYALFMDSDLTNDPADIPRFVELMLAGVDVIKASRYAPGGRMEGVPLQRRIISGAGNTVARLLFGMGIRDCTNGFRAVKLEILSRMDLREPGFPIIVEELYHCKTLARTFAEVPVVLTNRAGGQRPTSFTYKPETFRKYFLFALKAFLHIKPRRTEYENPLSRLRGH